MISKLVFCFATLCLIQVSVAELPSTDDTARVTVQAVVDVTAEILEAVNHVAQEADKQLFPDPQINRNNTIKLYIQIGTTLFDHIASVLNGALSHLNGTNSDVQRVVKCIEAQEADLRKNVENNVRFWAEGVTQQVPNLSVGFKDQIKALDLITQTVVDGRDQLRSCKSSEALCIAQLASSLASGLTDDSDVLVKGTKEVLAAYKIMFGTDVPTYTKRVRPLIDNDLSEVVENFSQCLTQ